MLVAPPAVPKGCFLEKRVSGEKSQSPDSVFCLFGCPQPKGRGREVVAEWRLCAASRPCGVGALLLSRASRPAQTRKTRAAASGPMFTGQPSEGQLFDSPLAPGSPQLGQWTSHLRACAAVALGGLGDPQRGPWRRPCLVTTPTSAHKAVRDPGVGRGLARPCGGPRVLL